MPSSSSEARSRVGLLALVLLPLWACATGVDNAPAGSSSLEAGGAGGDASDGGSASSSAGSGSSASAGKSSAGAGSGVAGSGASGASSQSGAPGSAGSAGKAGASNAGSSAGGANSAGSGGKGGTTSGGASTGGSAGSGVAGSGVAGSGVAGSGVAGSGAGSSNGGATGGTPCDAEHSVATIPSGSVYTGKANDCVRLAVNLSWAVIGLKFIPQPGTGPYPVPFSFFSCGGNGTSSLTADNADMAFKTGPNPGCDFFVQFEGGATTIKVTYYN